MSIFESLKIIWKCISCLNTFKGSLIAKNCDQQHCKMSLFPVEKENSLWSLVSSREFLNYLHHIFSYALFLHANKLISVYYTVLDNALEKFYQNVKTQDPSVLIMKAYFIIICLFYCASTCLHTAFYVYYVHITASFQSLSTVEV